MPKKNDEKKDALRFRAEKLLQGGGGEAGASAVDHLRLLHELQVHQIELELQNEELLQARAQTEAGLKRYTNLFDFAPMGYLVIGFDGLIREGNLAAGRLMRLERAKLAGARFDQYILPHDRSSFKGFLLRVEEGLIHESCEVTLLAIGGPPRIARISGLVQEGGGTCMVTMADITAQRAMEEQLRQAQKMEAIGQLAGGVAHDFNNMLGVILGYTEMAMQQAGLKGEGREALQQVRIAALHSADLTQRLLAFARRQVVTPRIVDLNVEMPAMLETLRPLMGEGVSLDWEPGPSLWLVKIDPTQLSQVLTNLLFNAREAFSNGGKVAIATRNVSSPPAANASPGDYVMLSVTDNGKGMAPALLNRIFEPFFTTKGPGKGSGLGLAMVYGAVQQNLGAIDVKSNPGRGTAVRIYLPRSVPRLAAGPSGVKAASSPPSAHPTVLLAEDEKSLLKICATLLEQEGYHVLAAHSGTEALDLAARHDARIDLLVTDVMMPGMNGKALRDSLETVRPGLKTLFMSGYTADIIASQGILEEGVEFLQKPFSVKEFKEKIKKILA